MFFATYKVYIYLSTYKFNRVCGPKVGVVHGPAFGAHWVHPPTKWTPMGTKCRALV